MAEKQAPKKTGGDAARKKKTVLTSPRKTTLRTTASVIKKVRLKQNKTATATKAKIKRQASSSEEVLTLPTRVSAAARLRERMLRMELDEHLEKAMYRIAYAAGLCFLLVGSAYALVPAYVPSHQSAAVISSNEDTTTLDGTTSTTDDTTVDDTETSSGTTTETTSETIQYEPSEFTFITLIPDAVTETLDVYFEVTNALGVVANIKVVGTTGSLSLPVEQISDIKYRTTIKPELFAPDYYKIFVYVRPLDGSQTYVRSSHEFFVGYPETTDNTTVTYEPSEFTFLTTIPDSVVEKTTVDFQATNAEKVSARLILVGTTEFFDIPYTQLSSDKYRTVIDPTRVQAGYYKLQVLVKPLDGSEQYSRTTPQFFIGSSELEGTYNEQTASSTESTIQSETKATDDSEELNVQTENTTVEEEKLQTTNDEPESPIAVPAPIFEFLPPPQRILTDTATLQLLAPTKVSSIELYARQTNSLSARYVTTAFMRNDAWVFVFDSKNFPNGDYEFFARTQHNNKSLVTASLKLSVQNSIQLREQTTEQTTPITSPERDRRTETVRTPAEPIITEATNGTENNVRRILTTDPINFDELFKRYTLAQQNGDELGLKIAREELANARKQIYHRLIADQSERDIADAVAAQLHETIEDITNRIDTFELLRRERLSGITIPDTDNMPDSETIAPYESPKDLVGLARPDALEVREVLPVVKEPVEGESAAVLTEIRGRALPYSFVNLFIFSTPTVVTVKTDSDGSFVYTFDKELEDGQHDVYVAVTDNTGRIVAHSNRFSFIKEAQAFTPVDASESDVVTVTNILETTNKNTYTTTLGIAILAFGLILFVLGVSLRRGSGAVRYETIAGDESGNGPEPGSAKRLKNVQFVSQRKEHIDAS